MLVQCAYVPHVLYRIWECPIEPTEFGPAAKLPSEFDKEATKLPRAKRIPEPKPETRWEKFAKEKGIKKKKRERMVYDENTDQFAPRYGYKRVGSAEEGLPIMEVRWVYVVGACGVRGYGERNDIKLNQLL
jgi:regulator of ribosome biosynthesis